MLGVLDRLELVRRLLEPEGRLELTLPRRIRGERVAVGHRALRVEAQQSLGHLAQGGAHRLLHALPGRAAEPVEPRGAGVAAEVFRDQLETLDRQVEPIALGVLEQEKVALAITHLHRLQTQIAAEPVVFVDDDVAGRQVGERREGGAALVLGAPQRTAPRAEDFALGEHDDAEGGDREAGGALTDDDRQRLGPLERR